MRLWGRVCVSVLAASLISCRSVDRDGRDAAEFRAAARQAYAAILMESCPPTRAYPRSKVLADEIARLAAYEASKAETAAAVHLEIAKADERLRIAAGSCWADNHPEFALRHVEMAQSKFAEAFKALQALDVDLDLVDVGDATSATGAEYRARVADIIMYIEPMCRISAQTSNEQIVAPAREAVAEYRRGLGRSTSAQNFDVAREDAELTLSRTLVECSEPSEAPAAQLRQRWTDGVRAAVSDLERLRLDA